jgi:hypothetical protein
MDRQPTPSGKEAHPRRVASQEKASTLMGLPTSKPRKIPTVIGVSTLIPLPKETPALKRAKTGNTKNATHGCRRCSSRYAVAGPLCTSSYTNTSALGERALHSLGGLIPEGPDRVPSSGTNSPLVSLSTTAW